MYSFWRTKKALALLRIVVARFWQLVFQDYLNILYHLKIVKKKKEQNKIQISRTIGEKPIIFVSVCQNIKNSGGQKYNGGIKELNYLVKLLRIKGYDAYFVTYDGTYDKWLIDHQPTISLKDFKNKISTNSNYRCVSSWIESDSFIDQCPSFYFWDMELAATNNAHFSKLFKYIRSKKIINIAGISRTIQAWYLTTFNKNCVVVTNLIDQATWFEKPEMRIWNRIGYMNEGKHTGYCIKEISSLANKNKLNIDFLEISGEEQKVLDMMRTCNIYLSLNIGKEELFGEGCPRTIIESMAAGCVNISFDIIGNREIVIDKYNGLIAKNKTPESMTTLLLDTFDGNKIEYYRKNSKELLDSVYNLNQRWNAIKSFLQL